MKKGHVYTFVFMVVLTALLIFILALSYEGFKPAIAGNAQLRNQRAVLYVFDLEKDLTDQQVRDTFQQVIKEQSVKGVEGYALKQDGEITGYALPFEGAALWGSISGYLGVTADMSQTTGLVFTKQSETPGLGGRIDELVFREQFRGLPLKKDQPLKYGTQEGYTLDAITGATQTSTAVLKTLNNMTDQVIFNGEVE